MRWVWWQSDLTDDRSDNRNWAVQIGSDVYACGLLVSASISGIGIQNRRNKLAMRSWRMSGDSCDWTDRNYQPALYVNDRCSRVFVALRSRRSETAGCDEDVTWSGCYGMTLQVVLHGTLHSKRDILYGLVFSKLALYALDFFFVVWFYLNRDVKLSCKHC